MIANFLHNEIKILNSDIINIDILLGIFNICLLIALLYIYWGSYKDFKSKFTRGLLSFVLLLLLQNFIFTIFLILHPGFRGEGMGAPIFILNVIEFLALIILLSVTWK